MRLSFLFILFCLLVVTNYSYTHAASQINYYAFYNSSSLSNHPYVLLVHSWRKLEKEQPPTHEGRFKHKGKGWKEYRHKKRKEIYEFSHGKPKNLSKRKSSYYYYNYDRGYITDNCEFIKAPRRVCWYNKYNDRICRWRLKWQYKCF